MEEHLAYCQSLRLRGRIFIAHEEINGTVSGLTEDVETHISYMQAHPLFSGIVFKVDEAENHAFHTIHVLVKSELMNFRLEADVNPKELTGEYIEPAEFYQRLQDPNIIEIDALNDYEHNVGHFKGAIKPDILNFRLLPKLIEANRSLPEGKHIMAYCTGEFAARSLPVG